MDSNLINEAMNVGTWGDLGSLYEKVPRGLIEMLGVPGLGPKRIKQFYDELGIERHLTSAESFTSKIHRSQIRLHVLTDTRLYYSGIFPAFLISGAVRESAD